MEAIVNDVPTSGKERKCIKCEGEWLESVFEKNNRLIENTIKKKILCRIK